MEDVIDIVDVLTGEIYHEDVVLAEAHIIRIRNGWTHVEKVPEEFSNTFWVATLPSLATKKEQQNGLKLF